MTIPSIIADRIAGMVISLSFVFVEWIIFDVLSMKTLPIELYNNLLVIISGSSNFLFNISDNLSGIINENNISLFIDKNPMIFEYNSYRKEVILELQNTLSLGEHSISIDVLDNVGNLRKKSGIFYIIP